MFTLITNDSAKRTKNKKVKPLQVGEDSDNNVIYVCFSKSDALRGYYSHNVDLAEKALYILYLAWHEKRYKSPKSSATKRRKFKEFLEGLIKKKKRIADEKEN